MNNSNTVVIIQARMGSTRLHGKVMMDIGGRPMLAHVVERAQQIGYPVIVATGHYDQNKEIISWCQRNHVDCFTVSDDTIGEYDVLYRFVRISKIHSSLEHVIRVTADCPLFDPALACLVIEAYRGAYCVYAAASCGLALAHSPDSRHWPDGLDVECISAEIIGLLDIFARGPDREHVTSLLWRVTHSWIAPEIVKPYADYSGYRFTVDSEQDLTLMRRIFEGAARVGIYQPSWRDAIRIVDADPELAALMRQGAHGCNYHYSQLLRMRP